MIDKAIKKINPKAYFIVHENDIDRIEWLDGTTPIPKNQIKQKVKEVEQEFNNNKYQRDRQSEYPTIEDQLDDIYHNGVAGWKQTIKAVKDKYPKG